MVDVDVDGGAGGDDGCSYTELKLTSTSAPESPCSSLGTCFSVENVECQVKNKKVVM